MCMYTFITCVCTHLFHVYVHIFMFSMFKCSLPISAIRLSFIFITFILWKRDEKYILNILAFKITSLNTINSQRLRYFSLLCTFLRFYKRLIIHWIRNKCCSIWLTHVLLSFWCNDHNKKELFKKTKMVINNIIGWRFKSCLILIIL